MNRRERRRHEAIARKRDKRQRRQRSALQTALLASATAGILATANVNDARAQVVLDPSVPAIPAQCTQVSATAFVCEGNLAAGLDVNGTAATLTDVTVQNVTGNLIAPAAGTIGIDFYSPDGAVTVSSTTNIVTNGADADGIFARSFDLGVSTVTVTSQGDITTAGNRSAGIRATSNYGAVTVTSTGDLTTTGNQAYGIRAVGSFNGTVTVNSIGAISTNGTSARGIFATANGTSSVTVRSTGNISVQGNNAVGIFANANNDGNATVISEGDVSTQGDSAFGISSNTANAGTATLVSTGRVTTNGSNSDGLIAYSQNGAVSITSVGDLSTDGLNAEGIIAFVVNNAPATGITINSTGDITTTQDGSEGIRARLYAGGGDIFITSNGAVSTSGANSGGVYGLVSGNGNITITSSGHVTTNGDNAEGIEAYITGNGAVNIVSDGNVTTNGTGSEGIRGYVTGAGSVNITSRGDIVVGSGTSGEGIEGHVGANGNVSISSVGNISVSSDEGIRGYVGGNGNVTIVSRGNITTPVDEEGIDGYVRGSGHVVISSVGNIISEEEAIRATVNGTGSITVDSTGNLTALDPGQHGLQVRNYGGGSSVVTILGGTITGGGGAADGVNFASLAGSSNTLNIRNSVTISSVGGTAIEGSNGNDTINNFGTLNTVTNGAIELGAGTNAFNNRGGAIFNAGGIVNLGAGNIFSNSGILSPGASGTIRTTAITGTVVQDGGGIFLSTVDPSAGTGDLVTVTETATLAGNVQAFVINPAFGNQSVTILSAAGGTTNNGLGLLASPALQASLTFPNANDVVLNYSIDFSAGGLNPNQTALAGSLNSALANGLGGLEPVLDPLLNNIFTVGDYRNALNQLLPEVMLNTETATLFSSEEFVENLFSCRLAGENHTALSEGECYWARPQGRFLDRDSDANTIGFDETSGGLAAGAQVAVAPNWFAGFALGYERASLDTDTGAETDANRFSGGLSLKYQTGSFLLGAAISGGVSGNDTQRPISIGGVGGFNATADSNYAIKTLTGQARAAYVFQFRDWFAKPLVDVTATYLSRDGVTETGAGAANLALSGSDETFFSVTPALEIGGDFTLSETSVIRPYVRAGVSFYTDSDHGLTARFVNAPASTSAFAITSNFDDVFADVAAGATAFFDNGSTLGLSYEGLISSDTQQHGLSLKGTIAF